MNRVNKLSAIQKRILEFLNESHSTKEVVSNVYGLNPTPQLHRKALHHINALIRKGYVKVIGKQGKGEKTYTSIQKQQKPKLNSDCKFINSKNEENDFLQDNHIIKAEFGELPSIQIQSRKSNSDIIFEDISIHVKGHSLNECYQVLELLGKKHDLFKKKPTNSDTKRDISVG